MQNSHFQNSSQIKIHLYGIIVSNVSFYSLCSATRAHNMNIFEIYHYGACVCAFLASPLFHSIYPWVPSTPFTISKIQFIPPIARLPHSTSHHLGKVDGCLPTIKPTQCYRLLLRWQTRGNDKQSLCDFLTKTKLSYLTSSLGKRRLVKKCTEQLQDWCF